MIIHAYAIGTLLAAHVASLRYTQVYNNTRWFFVHFVVNSIIFVFTIPHVLAAFFDIANLSQGETYAQKFPIVLALWVHLYHFLFFKMTKEDVFHHLVFIPTIALPGYMYDWAGIGNIQLFFICGFPGGVIYLVLFLQKTSSLYLNEPKISAIMNVCCRMPGVLIANGLLVHAYRNDHVSPPLWAFLLQVVLAPMNSIYYARQSYKRATRKQKEERCHV